MTWSYQFQADSAIIFALQISQKNYFLFNPVILIYCFKKEFISIIWSNDVYEKHQKMKRVYFK